MTTNRDVWDLIGFTSVNDAITVAIIGLLKDDAEVRQAAADYIEACIEEDRESPAAIASAECKMRQAIAPKIKDALVKHGREWNMPDSADELVDQFVDDFAFVEFYVEA